MVEYHDGINSHKTSHLQVAEDKSFTEGGATINKDHSVEEKVSMPDLAKASKRSLPGNVEDKGKQIQIQESHSKEAKSEFA